MKRVISTPLGKVRCSSPPRTAPYAGLDSQGKAGKPRAGSFGFTQVAASLQTSLAQKKETFA
jgi:hypothetical protein